MFGLKYKLYMYKHMKTFFIDSKKKRGAIITIYSIFNFRKWTNDLSPLKCRMFELGTLNSYIFCLDSGTTCESPWYIQFVWCLYNLNNAVSLTVSLSYYTLLNVGKSHLMHVYM